MAGCVAQRTGRTAPEYITDGTPARFEPFESGYSPSDPADRAIMATRNAVFPPPRAHAVTSTPDHRAEGSAPRVPDTVTGRGTPRSLAGNTAGFATWLDAREPSSRRDLTYGTGHWFHDPTRNL